MVQKCWLANQSRGKGRQAQSVLSRVKTKATGYTLVYRATRQADSSQPARPFPLTYSCWRCTGARNCRQQANKAESLPNRSQTEAIIPRHDARCSGGGEAVGLKLSWHH
jgi:hypothetical protein